jgi:hypothetical protein
MKVNRKQALKKVRFLRGQLVSQTYYREAEIADFDEEIANKLVERGAAVFIADIEKEVDATQELGLGKFLDQEKEFERRQELSEMPHEAIDKLKVFVSSVIRGAELKEERAAACKKIGAYLELLEPRCFELIYPESVPPMNWSIDEAARCDIFVQLLDQSITPIVRQEYQTAKKAGKPRIVLLKENPSRDEELSSYIGALSQEIIYGPFSDIALFEHLLKGSLIKTATELASGRRRIGKHNEDCLERAKAIRNERLGKLYARKRPAMLNANYPKVVLHLVPCGTTEERVARIDLESVGRDRRFTPLYEGSSAFPVYDAHSVMQCSLSPDQRFIVSSVEFFQNGIVEAIELIKASTPSGQESRIDMGYEDDICNQLPQYLSLLEQQSVRPPIYIALSFKEMRGFSLWVNPEYVSIRDLDRHRPIADDSVPVDFEVLDSFNDTRTTDQARSFMRPLFDVLWRKAGWPRSLNYDNEGNWRIT